jgi:hypothetical protein
MGATSGIAGRDGLFHAPAEQKPAEIELKVNRATPWVQRLVDLIEAGVARWKDMSRSARLTLGGNLDLVYTFLPAKKLLLALVIE